MRPVCRTIWTFPFDIRWTLSCGANCTSIPGVYEPDPKRSAEWNRGAYLVEGRGTLRRVPFAAQHFRGDRDAAQPRRRPRRGKWLAPNISADPRWGIGDRSVSGIVTFLKTGAHDTEGVAFGPMAEVVHDSLRYVFDRRSAGDRRVPEIGTRADTRLADKVASRGDLRTRAEALSGQLRQMPSGRRAGFPGFISNLAANAAVTSAAAG